MRIATLSFLLFLTACGGSETPAVPDAPAPADLPMVEVTAEGANLDPAAELSQIPDGAYYCDMGTSHYARSEKGDNTCPRCGMDLKHKGQ